VSLGDSKEIVLEMFFADSVEHCHSNPLGTTFDLANCFVGEKDSRLKASPFLHCWDETTESEYQGLFGIWLFHTGDQLVIRTGSGQRSQAPADEFAMFFVVPPELKGSRQTMRLVVVCMN